MAFSDTFSPSPSAQWSNYAGGWSATGGAYAATTPSNAPATATDLPYHLGDFSATVTINNLTDGGIWIHSDGTNQNGILLVVGGGGYGQGIRGGVAGTSRYWHTVTDGTFSAQTDEVDGVFDTGGTHTITVTAVGDVYSAYVDGPTTPTTTLTTDLFPSGQVGLYDDQPNVAGGGSGSPLSFGGFSLTGTSVPSVLSPSVAGKLPASLITGQAAAIRQALTLANAGSVIYDGQATTQWFLDTGTNLDANAVAITTPTAKPYRLKADGRTAASLHLTTLPSTVAAGTYHLIAEVTDADGDMSVATSATTIAVAPPIVALAAKVTAVSATSVTPGKPLLFTLTVTNGGNVSSTGAATIAVYLSVDRVALTIPVPLKSGANRSTQVKVGGRGFSTRLRITVPTAAAAMSLYALVVSSQGGRTVSAASAVPVPVG